MIHFEISEKRKHPTIEPFLIFFSLMVISHYTRGDALKLTELINLPHALWHLHSCYLSITPAPVSRSHCNVCRINIYRYLSKVKHHFKSSSMLTYWWNCPHILCCIFFKLFFKLAELLHSLPSGSSRGTPGGTCTPWLGLSEPEVKCGKCEQ